MDNKKGKILTVMVCLVMVATIFVLAPNVKSANALTASDILVTTYTDERLLKLDLDGNVIWNIDIGAPTSDVLMNPNDGSIYVISNYANTNGYLTKLDSNGNILWNKDISYMCVPGAGGPSNMDIDPNDGSIYVISLGGAGNPFGLYKFDSNGNLLWDILNGLSSYYDFQSVAVNPTDGSIYLNGYVQGVHRFDSDGNLIWRTDISPVHNSYGSASIAVNPIDGSAVVISRFTGLVAKLDIDGNILWQTSTSRDNVAIAVDPNTDAVYVIGTNYLHKLDLTNGDLIWEREHFIGHSGLAVAVNCNDGSIYIGTWDRTLRKVDPNDGSILWTKELGYYVVGISIAYKYTISSTIDIDPDTLNLRSKHKFITCYIELPEGYYVEDIVIDTIALTNINNNLFDPPLYTVGPSEIGDYDDDGIPDLMVKFDRRELIPLLEVGDAELTVAGEPYDETPFEGSDTIRVIDKGKGN